MAQLEDSRAIAGRVSVPNFHGFSALYGVLQRGRALLPPADWAERAPLLRLPAESSASITTRSSTRPPTCNTSPGSAAHGSASTGATTAAWSPAPFPAPAATRQRPAAPGSHGRRLGSSSPISNSRPGLFCGGVAATAPHQPVLPDSSCPASQYGSTLVTIPAPGNRKRRPQSAPHRAPSSVRPRHRPRQSLPRRPIQVETATTAVNVTNKTALYNFLSTFSGTHYVTPRTLTAQSPSASNWIKKRGRAAGDI